MKKAFDVDAYLKLQSEEIVNRVSKFGDKLYLEFGGKLFDDFHASRVLPGFLPDTKLKMLKKIKDKVEVVIVISAIDIQNNKIRADLGISYETDVLRLIDAFRDSSLFVGSVVITKYTSVLSVDQFISRLNNLNIKTYLHYSIASYPHNIPLILSDNGFGKNEYIKTEKPIIVVTAPGPGSGKMATCLSQLYHDHEQGINAGYAKYETFPIWNLPLSHPVNLSYEAATADLNDVNMIDPFHLEAYNKTVVNYNRDVEVFPVLKSIFEKIYGESPYKSPTDMGVNMAGFAIVDDEAARKASKDEVVRRYLNTVCDFRYGKMSKEACDKVGMLMRQLNVSVSDRACVGVALKKHKEFNSPAMAIELNNGKIVSAKASDLFGAAASAILKGLKSLAGIDESVWLIPYNIIEAIQKLKVDLLGNPNMQLSVSEVLIALSIAAKSSDVALSALNRLNDLKTTQAHSTVVLAQVDEEVLKKLQINLTTEPNFSGNKLYIK